MASIFDSTEFNQNLFYPRPDRSAPPKGKEEIYVEVEDSIPVHIRRHPSESAKFSLLYFHGNGEIVSDYDDMEPHFSALGAEFLVCDYRGYGKSQGYSTLRNALKDACLIFETLKGSGKLLDRVFVMGRSLGSASAIELCAKYKDIACCVIESGYADPIPLVERRGLKIGTMTPEENAVFNNSEKIKNITCPLLVMHGGVDELISPVEAQLNYDNAHSKLKLLNIFDGVGHNDILLARNNAYFRCLENFFRAAVEEGT